MGGLSCPLESGHPCRRGWRGAWRRRGEPCKAPSRERRREAPGAAQPGSARDGAALEGPRRRRGWGAPPAATGEATQEEAGRSRPLPACDHFVRGIKAGWRGGGKNIEKNKNKSGRGDEGRKQSKPATSVRPGDGHSGMQRPARGCAGGHGHGLRERDGAGEKARGTSPFR